MRILGLMALALVLAGCPSKEGEQKDANAGGSGGPTGGPTAGPTGPTAPATGPLDPAIPTVRLDSPRVLGLGVCAPGSALGPNPAGVGAIGAIWRIASNRAVNVTFAPLVADPTRPPRPGVTSLYRSVHDPAAWAPGRYVIALDVPALADGGVRGRQFLAVVVPVGQ